MIVDTLLPIYAVALAGLTAWTRYKRPDLPRMAVWLAIPAVSPVAASLAWLAVYALDADVRLATSLFLAYAMPTWLIGIPVCIAADVVIRKVRAG